MNMQVKRLVVGVDGSEHARRALSWALSAARLHGADLEAVHVVPEATEHEARVRSLDDDLAEPSWTSLDLHAASRRMLDEQLAEIRSTADDAETSEALQDVEVALTVLAGRPAEVLERRAADADMLVVGSRGHGGFVGLLLGSVGLHCIASCDTPVVVVPSAKHGADRPGGDLVEGGRRSRRVVVGVDEGSSRRAVLTAAREAVRRDSTLELVMAYEGLSPAYFPYFAPGLDVSTRMGYRERAREAAEERLEAAASMVGRRGQPPVTLRAIEGRPASALLEASAGADLLVVGARGRTELRGAVLGSVGQQCVAHSTCPVAVVRSSAALSA